ncbi:HD domain-containing protein [Gordonia sp. L191]|uniref:HD domain-containing protein n=1 Tax=Gordonia sp. L191 TaxID=2982699 RepID=UPI0024C038C0|nr:HD domain-containing protein [Gordonia sp. L191]WHU47235.1 HD domain-containing protein [Gordonia sp. L191]
MATEYCTPALLNHSLRSYVWAAAHARASRLQLDHELLYVAALLHDIGLVAEFDNHSLAFEDAGGHIASVLTAGAGWTINRRARARRIIVEHMAPEQPNTDAESRALWLATGYEFSGAPLPMDTSFRAEVLRRYPRLDIASEFSTNLRDQTGRKPGCAAAHAVADDILTRIAANPLDAE